MSAPLYRETVNKLKSEYADGVMYGETILSQVARDSIVNIGFMGSAKIIELKSRDIIHEAPGCVAAPKITMMARNQVSIGMAGQGTSACPVRLYAPKKLSIKADHILIGELRFVVEPENGLMSCKSITIKNVDNAVVEIIKSWIENDEAEVKINHS